jgi:predicted nucleic acid-binding protein
MILADTSVWVGHFRFGDDELTELLNTQGIVMHPFIVAELALGSMAHRDRTIALLDRMPSAKVALTHEVRQMIKKRSLHGRGIGLIEAHLIASAQLHTRLWTRDKRLRAIAEELGIHADLP